MVEFLHNSVVYWSIVIYRSIRRLDSSLPGIEHETNCTLHVWKPCHDLDTKMDYVDGSPRERNTIGMSWIVLVCLQEEIIGWYT